MSKRKGWKAEQRRPEASGYGTRISAKTLEKVNVIKNSAWRHAGEDGSSSEGEEEEEQKRQGTNRNKNIITISRSHDFLFDLTCMHPIGVVSRTLATYLQLLEGEEEGSKPVLNLLHLTTSWSCLICLSTVRRVDAVWNCDQCGCMFHLVCVQQWAKDSLALPPSASPLSPHLFPDVTAAKTWSCPKCRRDYMHSQVATLYYCFCRKKVCVCVRARACVCVS